MKLFACSLVKCEKENIMSLLIHIMFWYLVLNAIAGLVIALFFRPLP